MAAVDGGPTVGSALRDATVRLREAGSPSARLDAEVLLAHVTARDRASLLAHPEMALEDPTAFERAVERRAGGEPIAYIRGFKEWHSLRIRTDGRALIPRPETELLADATAIEIERRLHDGSVVAWEVATGSGAVATVLALRFRAALEDGALRLLATDISEDALALATENLEWHGVRDLVELDRADLLAGAGEQRPLADVVAANLPYVSTAEVDERRGSLGYEPRLALDGGDDGLVVVRRLLQALPGACAPGATAILELGVGQVEAIRALAPRAAAVTVVPDLAGLDRVVRLDLP